MSLPSRTVKSALKRKGFEEQKDSHHLRYRYRSLNGELSGIRTHMSHNTPKDLPNDLVSKMAKQCNLSTRDFRRFVKCDMDQEEYENAVKKHL